MKLSDRRLAHRFRLTIPLFIREWKTTAPEKRVQSVNVSERGVCFETDTPLLEGTMLQIRLDMPMEITGIASVEWRCTGRVMGIRPATSLSAPLGVRVRFDYYEVLRTAGQLPELPPLP
ncbi:MAG: PilZ domain-containing protein [Candidatus Acidiferrales bacterium]|jgi:hypothetical protein